jgi:acyl dehydratase
MGLTVATPADLLPLVGAELDPTDWVEVTQERINLFADATGDQSHDSAAGTMWGGVGGGIHVDVERAKAESPFGGPIAHGYLTLSLVNLFLPDLLAVEQFSMGVNVGLDKVRFTSPVPSGARIRARGEVVSAEEVKGGVQVVVRVTVEIEGADRPACIADTVSRFFP